MTGGPILITGCSTGIGRATATLLAHRGHTVIATARKPETLGDLEALGCTVLPLDLTDEQSIRDAVREAERLHGPILGLVNNAGYAEIGSAEDLSMERLRRQFATNLFGPWLLCQLVLPGMRAARSGRVVNVGSIGDRCVFPLWSAYASSKHALAAFTDALRMETAQHGVQAVLVEPGVITTAFATTLERNIDGHAPAEAYSRQTAGLRQTVTRTNLRLRGGSLRAGVRPLLFAKISRDPLVAARVIATALTASRPRTRYRVPAHAHAAFAARALLPDRLWDAAVKAAFLGKAP